MALLKLTTHLDGETDKTYNVIANLDKVASIGESRGGGIHVVYVSGQKEPFYDTAFESIRDSLQRGADFILGTDNNGDRILTNINSASTLRVMDYEGKTTLTAAFHKGEFSMDRISVESKLGASEVARLNSLVIEP